MSKRYTGVNIQFPISRLIVLGEKSIETRTYPLPEKYVGRELLLVETPGSEGDFKARAIAVIKFGQSFKYKSEKEFYRDIDRHKVDRNSPWAYNAAKGKWGWPVLKVEMLKVPRELSQRKGIRFTKDIEL